MNTTSADIREERQQTAGLWRFIFLYLATITALGAVFAMPLIADWLWTL